MNTFINKTKLNMAASALAIAAMVLSLVPMQAFAQANENAGGGNGGGGGNSGAIWTTLDGCADTTQDANTYDVGDTVFINGSGFDVGTYSWVIEGQPGGASTDPNIIVASGQVTVDATGNFCINAYTIPVGDDGTYNVKVGNKGDSYRVNGVTTGTITVNKIISGISGLLASSFSYILTANTVAGTPVSFTDTTTNNGSKTETLALGTNYSIVESGVTNGQVTVGQNTFNVTTSLTGCTGTISTTPAICTITNTYVPPNPTTGTIVLVKNTNGGDGQFGFASATLGPIVLNTSAGTATQTFTQVAPGSHSITETIPTDWTLSNVVCADPTSNSSVSVPNANATIDLAAGETVTCTFTNTKNLPGKGTIVVDKITNPAADAQSFSFTTTGTDYIGFSLTDAATPNSQQLDTGTYSVSETVPAGWTQTSVSCESSLKDIEVATALELDENEVITCTFTNTKDPVRCDNPAAQNFGQVGECVVFESTCIDPQANLLTNGSFEDPAISSSWAKSVVANWNVTKVSDGTPSLGEVWRGYAAPSHLLQNLELDGDYPTMITQATTTIPGATYELRFDFSARSGGGVADNSIVSAAGGLPLTSVATANTNWTTYGATFVATTTTTNISFADAGTPNSLGTLLDNAVLCLVKEPAPVDYCKNIDDIQAAGEGYLKDVNGMCYKPIESCSVTVVSDTTNTENGDAAIVVVDQPLYAWVAGIQDSVAQWIWGSPADAVIDGTVDESQTFVKTFVWSGTASAAVLKLAADNFYSVKLNGVEVGGELVNNDNFTSLDTINLTDDVIQGVNTLEITVTNDANGKTSLSSANGNPAGLLYDLTITDTTGDCGDGGGEGEPEVLSCTISATPNSVRRGRDVTLSWASTKAVRAELNGEVVSLTGSKLIENLREDTTYTLTVWDSEGEGDSESCAVTVDTTSSGGGGNRAGDRDGEVLGDSDSATPEPLVLGEQTSAVPTGAPNTGKGGTALEVMGQFLALPRRRN